VRWRAPLIGQNLQAFSVLNSLNHQDVRHPLRCPRRGCCQRADQHLLQGEPISQCTRAHALNRKTVAAPPPGRDPRGRATEDGECSHPKHHLSTAPRLEGGDASSTHRCFIFRKIAHLARRKGLDSLQSTCVPLGCHNLKWASRLADPGPPCALRSPRRARSSPIFDETAEISLPEAPCRRPRPGGLAPSPVRASILSPRRATRSGRRVERFRSFHGRWTCFHGTRARRSRDLELCRVQRAPPSCARLGPQDAPPAPSMALFGG